ncbi:MAG: redoxin domain-containing protein [Bacteroidia bacterium]|nr:redoxin domain-containing protein [Bacteroidia bacterium]
MSKFMYITCLGFIIGLFAFYKPVFAQDSIKISNFTLENAQGQALSLDSLAGKKLTVVIFTSSHCSYAVQYKDRLISIYEKYRGKEVNFIAINSNDPSMSARDSASRMQAISGFPFPYLKDADQRVAKMFHATKTPEVVVLAPREKNYNIAYRGMIDDNPLDVTLVKEPYLSNAIDSLLINKKPLSSQTTLTGCNIKWIE